MHYERKYVKVSVVFIARSSYACAVLVIVILSVRPSVWHTRALWRNQRTYCRYFDTTWKGNHSSLLIPTQVGGNLRLKWPIPFEKRRFRPISAYDVSTVRASEKCLIITNRKLTTRFPTSYRWSAYITPNSPKRGSKSKFVVFVNKIQVQSNKVCYIVSLSNSKVVVEPFPYLMVYKCWRKSNPSN